MNPWGTGAGVARQYAPVEPCHHDLRDTSPCSFDTYVLHLTNRHNRPGITYFVYIGYVLQLI